MVIQFHRDSNDSCGSAWACDQQLKRSSCSLLGLTWAVWTQDTILRWYVAWTLLDTILHVLTAFKPCPCYWVISQGLTKNTWKLRVLCGICSLSTSQRSIFTRRAFRVFCAFKHNVIGVWHIGGLIPGELLTHRRRERLQIGCALHIRCIWCYSTT